MSCTSQEVLLSDCFDVPQVLNTEKASEEMYILKRGLYVLRQEFFHLYQIRLIRTSPLLGNVFVFISVIHRNLIVDVMARCNVCIKQLSRNADVISLC